MDLTKGVLVTLKDGRQVRGMNIRAVLEHYAPKLAETLTKRGALQGVIRRACYLGGEMWIREFLPKRFDMSYARSLGYSSRASYDAWKEKNVGKSVSFGQGYVGTFDTASVRVSGPQPQPFVLSGASKASVLSTPVVHVTMTGGDLGRLKMRIGFQAGMINRLPRNAAAFTKVPAHEYARVAAAIERVIRRELLPMAQSGQITNKYRFAAPRTSETAMAARASLTMKERAI